MNPIQRAVLAAVSGKQAEPFVFKGKPKPYVPRLTKRQRKALQRQQGKAKAKHIDPVQIFPGESAIQALQRCLNGGMMQPWYRGVYLHSAHWKRLSGKVKVLADGKCQDCGLPCSHPDVHHLRYRHIFDVKVSDLRALCRGCHEERHARS